jgi:hypothetical protein
MTVILQNVRASFPRIVEPEINKSFPNSPAKYSMNIILPKGHPGMDQFMAEVQALAVEKWKEHAATILGMANGNKKLRCYGAGEEVMNTTTFEVYKGYPGMIYLSAASDKDHPPQIVKRDANGLAQVAHDMERQELAKRIYGGCYVNVAITPWLQDNAGGRAVRCNLHAIEFAADGEPLGDSGGVDVKTLFGSVPAPAAAAPTAAVPGGMSFPGMPSFLS